MYYQLQLEGDRVVTVYQDLIRRCSGGCSGISAGEPFDFTGNH